MNGKRVSCSLGKLNDPLPGCGLRLADDQACLRQIRPIESTELVDTRAAEGEHQDRRFASVVIEAVSRLIHFPCYPHQ
jgi:hypothetical protein